MNRKEVLEIVNECFRCYATNSRLDAKDKANELMDKKEAIEEKNKLLVIEESINRVYYDRDSDNVGTAYWEKRNYIIEGMEKVLKILKT